MTIRDQWIRKIGLIVFSGENGLDLSSFRIVFNVQNMDEESPNSCSIRVYNLGKDTIDRIRGEFNNVVLNAGYSTGNYGVIFQGTIKQFKIGKENATDTYLDILAADGDIAYNQSIVNTSLAKGSTPIDTLKAITSSMPNTPLDTFSLVTEKQYTPNIRGAVLFGMARAKLRNVASTLDASWSIQNGQVVLLDNTGYLEGEAVKINIGSGLIGMPEQTDGGIRIKCLLNSRLRIGGLIQLNNDDIIQLMQSDPTAAPVPYNHWASFQFLAPLASNGLYRAFTVEHEGDNRGGAWYSNITCLAVKPDMVRLKAVGAT